MDAQFLQMLGGMFLSLVGLFTLFATILTIEKVWNSARILKKLENQIDKETV